MSTENLVLVSDNDHGVRSITLNRPEKRNAMSRAVLDELIPALANAEKDSVVKVIVITGSGSFFSGELQLIVSFSMHSHGKTTKHGIGGKANMVAAGADLKDIAALNGESARQVRYLEDLCLAMKAVRKPLLAAVNGPALGGGFELAMMCDLIFAAESAYFALPEVKRGLIPGAGGTQRLTAAVGKFRAMKTILYGKPISSEEALNAGLVCEVFKDAEILKQTLEAGQVIAQNAPQAMALAKEAVCRGNYIDLCVQLLKVFVANIFLIADALCQDGDFERHLYWQTFGTTEKYEGINMFLTKKSGGK